MERNVTKKRGLGRGLEALLGDSAPEVFSGDRLTTLPLDVIDVNPDQPRKRFDAEKLRELADSIEKVGVISPIVVYQKANRYVIVAGERRFRAARLAKLGAIPAVVRDYDEMRRMEVALIENLQRQDLGPMESAQGIRALIEDCAITQEEAAARLGMSRVAVTNLLRLLTLDEKTAALVEAGSLTQGHARALLGVKDDEARAQAAEKCVKNGWSVRQAEEYVRLLGLPRKKPAPRPRELRDVEIAFKKALGVRVEVTGTNEKGKISIRYDSLDELERIYELIGGDVSRET